MAITGVQRLGKAQASGTTIVMASGDTWATPTSGHLLVVTANSDATVTMTTSGFTAGPAVVDGNAAYAWWKVSAGTESTITLTPGSSAPIAITCCEYTGTTASPFDVSNSATTTGTLATSSPSVSVTTTVANDLVVVVAALHGTLGGSITAPTGPSWTNSFTNQLSPSSGGTGDTGCHSYFAERVVTTATAYATVCSWTNQRADRQAISMAFKEAATVSIPDLAMAPSRH